MAGSTMLKSTISAQSLDLPTANMLPKSIFAALLATSLRNLASAQDDSGPIIASNGSFALHGDNVSYRFHVDTEWGDLISDHFGGSADEDGISVDLGWTPGWVGPIGRVRREFPDVGRGDMRTPAVEIKHASGHTVSNFRYESHEIMAGKPSLPGLPHTFGEDSDVSTLIVHMFDNYSSVAADLSYSIFPRYDAIVRSVNITNRGNETIEIQNLASLSVDLPYTDLEMLQLRGDWGRETNRIRRKIDYGTQGFESRTGYSSHLNNPFLSLVTPTTNELHGEAWGFSLIYSGSFAVQVEKSSQDVTRATIGMNPYHLSWELSPGESFTSPECVSVFSDSGIGGMSRKYHRLFRNHLMKSKFALQERPPLLNSWEGLYFEINETSVYRIAEQAAELGAKLLVMDDGWFGNNYPRNNDTLGLGDWHANEEKFPNGLPSLVENITAITVANSSDNMRFGIWFEPEMVNPRSDLYQEHPDWVLHAENYPRTTTRSQLVLNVALPEVQEFIIESLSRHLRGANISYVKWDNNRGMHEMAHPSTSHRYILGLYKIMQNLTTEFPDVLFEGCASGGGRFDPGMLHYFPQAWTSDNTDAVERVAIQFGTSLVYPLSAMGAHISHVPNYLTDRTTSLKFRAHVALMGGSFGLELDPEDMDEDERAEVPEILALSQRLNPIIINGDLYRLTSPTETNHPSALVVSEDGNQVILFAYQIKPDPNNAWPYFRLAGLDRSARYRIDDGPTLSGATLMNIGIQLSFDGEFDSHLIILEKQ
ncbi:alpha-galactosidase [Stachybotrys elegans]|uniref:Alpha-galactosidase n=1 Tax=Stachybotrys elegans TaxID=80388 RepID=A0A8K0SV08_9HYPO|nr:alpha-galactosidase [Stachybotrys elegans]